MTVFSENLKRFRIAKNLTQEQAAEALCVSTQSVSRWECNTTLPDVTLLPKIAALYCVTIDDLYKETSIAYDNYAQRLLSIFEDSMKSEDFLRADMEYKKMLKSGEYSIEDLRCYGFLYQKMMQVCIKKAQELYDQGIKMGPVEDPVAYWATRRQKSVFLWRIGRNQENIDEYLPLVKAGSNELQEWICLIQAYSFSGDYTSGWECVQQAEDKFPENAMLHICAGDLLCSMKCYNEAIVRWQRALEMEPNYLSAAHSMAECYEKLGDFAKAMEVYNQIAETLEKQGFDSEVDLARTLAAKCYEKISTGQ